MYSDYVNAVSIQHIIYYKIKYENYIFYLFIEQLNPFLYE